VDANAFGTVTISAVNPEPGTNGGGWNGMFVIDYVIVHELAHLIESNHTPEFWNIVRARTAMMDKARAWLRDHGQVLEQKL
jgi:hypothetical protein